MQKLIFVFFFSIAILFFLPKNPGSQTMISNSQEIDMQGKTDQQIISILQNLVSQLKPSELEVAKIIQAEVEAEKRATDKAWDEIYSQRFQAVFAAYRKMDDQRFIVQNIEKELSDVTSELTSLEKKIEIAQTYIASKETEQQSIRDKMKSDLANLPLEVVMIGIAEYPSTIIEQDAVKAAIARAKEQAVERINGVFIQSQSLIAGGLLVEDIIKAVVGGKVEVRESLRQNYTRVGTPEIVHTIQRYAVFPLQKDISGSAPTTDIRIKTQAILLDANNVASLNDYPEEIVKQGKSMVEAAQSFNRNQQERISAVVIEAQASLDRLERDIRATRQQIKSYDTNKIELANRKERISKELIAARTLLQPLQAAYEHANEQLKKHLASRQVIHIDFKSAEKDPEKSRDDQYKELIRQCVIDFQDKVQTSYLQTISEVRNFMLVSDQSMKINVSSDIQAVQIIYLSYRQTEVRPSYGVALKFKAKLNAPQNAFGDYQPKMIAQKLPDIEKTSDMNRTKKLPDIEKTSDMNRTKSEKSFKGIEFVFVKGGTFDMGDTFGDGSADEKPVHSVTVSDFYMGKTEVTVAQYRNFCQTTGREMPSAPSWGFNDSHPIVNVSWNDANEFCKWAGCRLPTEAEWEYAAREGGKKVKWSGTSTESLLGDYAWYESNSGSKTHSVGTKKSNALGLYDLSGNVWEWCADWYDENFYKNSPKNNPKGPSSGEYRILRGGSWYFDERNCRSSVRLRGDPGYGSGNLGFRVARDSPL